MVSTMPTNPLRYWATVTSRYLISMCYCPLVTAQTAEKLPSISLPSMAAINGKYHSILYAVYMILS